MKTDQQRVRKAIDNKEWADKFRTIDSLKLLWTDLGTHVTFGDLMDLIESEMRMLSDSGAFHSERYDNPDKRYIVAISSILKRASL